jgi:hypothetical protein
MAPRKQKTATAAEVRGDTIIDNETKRKGIAGIDARLGHIIQGADVSLAMKRGLLRSFEKATSMADFTPAQQEWIRRRERKLGLRQPPMPPSRVGKKKAAPKKQKRTPTTAKSRRR